VTGTYGGNDFYLDGSAYINEQSGTVLNKIFSASAHDSATGIDYHGEINAYRYRIAPGSWSDWSRVPQVSLTDLAEGEYPFEFIARDLANVTTSDTARFTVRLVRQHLTTNVIIVAETRNGNGAAGSPHDFTVNEFYERVLGTVTPAVQYHTISYSNDSTRVGEYISPYDLKDAGLVLWHGDDKNPILFNDNLTVLRDFLNRGGRLILSGWDVFGQFSPLVDTVDFASGSFAREQLRVFSASRNLARTTRGFATRGFAGTPGFPDSVTVDPTKIPNSWAGRLDRCWTFQQRGECTVLGNLAVSNPDSNALADRTAAYFYDLSFRVAVFGVPLYYCHEDQVSGMMDALVPVMMQGLTPAN